MYTSAVFHFTRDSMMLTACWKAAGAFSQSKRHPNKAEKTGVGCKGRLSSVRFGNFDLLVPAVSDQRGKYGCITKRVSALAHARYWIQVFQRYGVQLSVVDTEAYRAVFFGNGDNWAFPLCQYPFDTLTLPHATSIGLFNFSGTLTGSLWRLVDRSGPRHQHDLLFGSASFFETAITHVLKLSSEPQYVLPSGPVNYASTDFILPRLCAIRVRTSFASVFFYLPNSVLSG